MRVPAIAITTGAPAGIGPEIVYKSLLRFADGGCAPELRIVVIGSGGALASAGEALGRSLPIAVWGPEFLEGSSPGNGAFALIDVAAGEDPVRLGHPSAEGGRIAYLALERAAQLAPADAVDAIVTAPEVARLKAADMDIEGPIPSDSVFVKARGGQYDAVVAMYRDQGHIPVKLLGFCMDPGTGKWTGNSGVNVTLGLPIVRTSVDHGTAFEIVGKGMANEESLIDAINLAVGRSRAHRANVERAGAVAARQGVP